MYIGKIHSKKYANKNTSYQWNNRCSIWGKTLSTAIHKKDRKAISSIRKHIKLLEKGIKNEKKVERKEDEIMSYLMSQGYPVEFV
jgi:hypothetical protein|tara:strand:- start:111 stop:365 length:255 start_codon:yes stop_codon:yes gene_type:complete